MNRNILSGIVILVLIGLSFAGVLLFKGGLPGGLTFTLQLPEAKGLKVGDFVYMQGVQIGDVQEVRLEGASVAAEIKIHDKDDLRLPADSYLFVWSDQLLTGKKCIIVDPGESIENVKRGAILQGESSSWKIIARLGPKRIQEVLGDIEEFLEK